MPAQHRVILVARKVEAGAQPLRHDRVHRPLLCNGPLPAQRRQQLAGHDRAVEQGPVLQIGHGPFDIAHPMSTQAGERAGCLPFHLRLQIDEEIRIRTPQPQAIQLGRINVLPTAKRRVDQRRICSRARQESGAVERRRQGKGSCHGASASGQLQAEDAAQSGRDPHGTARVAGQRERTEPRSHRDSRPAAGPSWNAMDDGIPRIHRRA